MLTPALASSRGPGVVIGSRQITGWLRNRALKSLERVAGVSDTNQLAFIRALGKEYPDAALKRIESLWRAKMHPGLNDALLREYLKALVAAGQIDTAPLDVLERARSSGGSAASLSSGAGAAAGQQQMAPLASGSSKEPLVVSVMPAGFWTQLWRTARGLLIAFFALSAFGALMDDRGGMSASRLSNHTIHTAETSDKRFSDVMGVDEAKQELEELVMYLKDPQKFTRLGGKLPKGCLLMGPPGTGKTLLARAVAGEAGVPFFYASGSEFEEMYVGVGARRVRDLFEAAKKRSPCIIFIDEIDAIGASRHLKEQQSMKMTLNQLLVEMDGFEQNAGVIVVGATNIADSLDPALLRPGRFDRHVVVPLPDVKGREQILKLHSSKIPLDSRVDLEALARGTPGMSGADLFNLVNQAALKAALDGAAAVTMRALDFAKDKILMGAERKSAVLTPETMRMTAYHEGGHALVAMHTDGADPVHKATIMPRGQALGMVQQLPEGDQTSFSRRQMLARLDVCMGGRVAEEIVYGKNEITSGASSDIYQATRLARNMVTKWGFSPELGVVLYNRDFEPSSETAAKIDNEVHRILTESYERASKIIKTNRHQLDAIAENLLSKESLSGSELKDIILNGGGKGGGGKGSTKISISRPASTAGVPLHHNNSSASASSSPSSSSSSS